MEDFSAYAFNKSHATCYALIAYQTAYLKAHFPTEFMAALLTADQGDTDKVAVGVSECERMKIKVLPPSVNESLSDFTPRGDAHIRFGLKAIKNIGQGIIDAILEQRIKGNVKSLEDFLSRVSSKELNKKALESLIKCGALDELGKREKMLAGLDSMLKYAQKIQRDSRNGQTDIFGLIGLEATLTLKLPDVPELPSRQKLAWEKELLGLYISKHPLSEFLVYFKNKVLPCSELSKGLIGRRVKLGGIITGIQKIVTKNSESMLFINLEDTTGSIEILVFPKLLKKDPIFWQKDKIILVEGKLNVRDGQFKLLCDQFKEINEGDLILTATKNKKIDGNQRKLIVSLSPNCPKEVFRKIFEVLSQNKGSLETFISIPNHTSNKKMKMPFGIDYSVGLKDEIENLLGPNSIKIIDKLYWNT